MESLRGDIRAIHQALGERVLFGYTKQARRNRHKYGPGVFNFTTSSVVLVLVEYSVNYTLPIVVLDRLNIPNSVAKRG